MLTLSNTISMVVYSQFIILLANLVFLYYEIKSFRGILRNSTTLSLIGFLLGILLMSLSRLIGMSVGSIFIRTYISAILGLFSAIMFINWGSDVIKLNRKDKRLFSLGFVISMATFIFTRALKLHNIEWLSILTLIFVFAMYIIKIFIYVFRTSPYIRARHRLFMLTISVILFSVFDGLAANYLGNQDYYMAALMFSLEIISRIGITLSILLPRRLTQVLNVIIK